MSHWIPQEKLEPDACASIAKTGAAVHSAVGAEIVQLSIAVSMKRIADAICGSDTNSGILHAVYDIATAAAPR